MEQTSQADSNPYNTASLEGQIREMYGRLAYTQKTHEKMADGYVSKYKRIKLAELVLSALSFSSLVLAVLGESRLGTIVGSALSAVLLGFLLYFKEATLGEYAQRHSETAAKLWGLRERMLSLLIDMRSSLPPLETRTRRDALVEELEAVYRGSPRTNAKAYLAAQRALKESEELFFTEPELDHLLPKVLRRDSDEKAN